MINFSRNSSHPTDSHLGVHTILFYLLLLISYLFLLPWCFSIILQAFNPIPFKEVSWLKLSIAILVSFGNIRFLIPISIYYLDQFRIVALKKLFNNGFIASLLFLICLIAPSLPVTHLLLFPNFIHELVGNSLHHYNNLTFWISRIHNTTLLVYVISVLFGLIFYVNLSFWSDLSLTRNIGFQILHIKKHYNLLRHTDFSCFCGFSNTNNIDMKEKKYIYTRTKKLREQLLDLTLADLDLTGCNFSKLNLSEVSFRGSRLENVKFLGSTLSGIDLSRATLANVQMDNKTNLTGVCIDGWSIDKQTLSNMKEIICEHFFTKRLEERQQGSVYDQTSMCPQSGTPLGEGEFVKLYIASQNWFTIYLKRGIPSAIEVISFYQYPAQEDGKHFKVTGFENLDEFMKISFMPITLHDLTLDDLVTRFSYLKTAISHKLEDLTNYWKNREISKINNEIDLFENKYPQLNYNLISLKAGVDEVLNVIEVIHRDNLIDDTDNNQSSKLHTLATVKDLKKQRLSRLSSQSEISRHEE